MERSKRTFARALLAMAAVAIPACSDLTDPGSTAQSDPDSPPASSVLAGTDPSDDEVYGSPCSVED